MTTQEEIIKTIANRIPYDRWKPPKSIAMRIWEDLKEILDLSDDHIINCTPAGWTLSHPPYCRPNLFECPYNEALQTYKEEFPIGQNYVRMEKDSFYTYLEFEAFNEDPGNTDRS